MRTVPPPAGDELEVLGIKRTFGEHAYKLLSSTKSMTGICWCGRFRRSDFRLLAMHDQVVPPTINLDNPQKVATSTLFPSTPTMKLDTVLSNSFGFGGTKHLSV